MSRSPSLHDVGKASIHLAEFDRLNKSRTTPEEFKKQRMFADLVLLSTGHKEGASDWSVVRPAIVLAFLLGLHYEDR